MSIEDWKISDCKPYYIYRSVEGNKLEYLCPDGKVHRWSGYQEGRYTNYYFKNKHEAELAIKEYAMNDLNAKLEQSKLDKQAIEKNIEAIKKEIEAAKAPKMKHGDVIQVGNSYYLWINTTGNTWLMGDYNGGGFAEDKYYFEMDSGKAVGNIFEGYNPWSKN
jgi:hypothetical protein